MRFLADESRDFAVVRALRAAGHDVVAVAELSPQAEDDTVMEQALSQARLLLTEDKDFGQLVYARARATASPRTWAAWASDRHLPQVDGPELQEHRVPLREERNPRRRVGHRLRPGQSLRAEVGC
jgi:hypothetical protein